MMGLSLLFLFPLHMTFPGGERHSPCSFSPAGFYVSLVPHVAGRQLVVGFKIVMILAHGRLRGRVVGYLARYVEQFVFRGHHHPSGFWSNVFLHFRVQCLYGSQSVCKDSLFMSNKRKQCGVFQSLRRVFVFFRIKEGRFSDNFHYLCADFPQETTTL